MQAKSCSIGVCVVGDVCVGNDCWRRGGSGGEKGTDKEEGTDEEEGADEEEEDGGVMPLSLAFSLSHSSASSRVLKLFC